jgi:thiamine biosynthesis lipoprotein
VATSGHSVRRLAVDGSPISHLLDPRTGRPAPDRGSTTVIAADPLTADAVATALAVLGPDEGATWVADRPGLAVVFAVADQNGDVTLRASRSLEDILRPRAGVRVEFFGSTCGSPAVASRAADSMDDVSPGEGAVDGP